MFHIVLDIELADQNVIKELGVFTAGNVHGKSFRPPKMYKPTNQAVWCTENLHGIVWNSGRLNYIELLNILPNNVKGEWFAKGTEKSKIYGSLLGKVVESLADYGCPKVQDVGDEKKSICSS